MDISSEPITEYLPEDTNLMKRFLACDPVNQGVGGTIYRAFAGTHYYVVLDARRAESPYMAGASRLVALQFPSRDTREAWLTQVLQSARWKSAWHPVSGSGSGGRGGAPLQSTLSVPYTKKLDA